MADKQKRNTLDVTQQVQLVDYLRQNAETITRRRLTLDEAAQFCQKGLGFMINTSNLRRYRDAIPELKDWAAMIRRGRQGQNKYIGEVLATVLLAEMEEHLCLATKVLLTRLRQRRPITPDIFAEYQQRMSIKDKE